VANPIPAMALLPSRDMIEFDQRSFEFVVEEPHRGENFAKSCRCLGSVGVSKRKNAVVSQISHDPRF
jgi:hypothetical protein